MVVLPGQILVLNMRVNNSGTIIYGHPYLILQVDMQRRWIEIAQIDSLKGKEYKAARKSNKVIFCDNPTETVIDKDSYIQMDNKLRIEFFNEVAMMRRQEDVLSQEKFADALMAYSKYQAEHVIHRDKDVFVTRKELEHINKKLSFF